MAVLFSVLDFLLFDFLPLRHDMFLFWKKVLCFFRFASLENVWLHSSHFACFSSFVSDIVDLFVLSNFELWIFELHSLQMKSSSSDMSLDSTPIQTKCNQSSHWLHWTQFCSPKGFKQIGLAEQSSCSSYISWLTSFLVSYMIEISFLCCSPRSGGSLTLAFYI